MQTATNGNVAVLNNAGTPDAHYLNCQFGAYIEQNTKIIIETVINCPAFNEFLFERITHSKPTFKNEPASAK